MESLSPLTYFEVRTLKHWGLALAILLTSYAQNEAIAQSINFDCGPCALSNGYDPFELSTEVRLVFIAYSSQSAAEKLLPTWADAGAAEFERYMNVLSGGRKQINVEVLRRPAPNDQACWVSTAQPLVQTFGEINTGILLDVVNTSPGVLNGVGEVWAIHKLDVFGSAVAGRPVLGLTQSIPGFSGDGVTTRMNMSSAAAKVVILHEYGHHFGVEDRNGIGFGQYDGMFGLSAIERGPRPYEFPDVVKIGWVNPVQITGNMAAVHLPDFYSEPFAASRVCFQINVPSLNGLPQYFLLVNHQGMTEFDQYGPSPAPGVKYVGKGMIIWQVEEDPSSGLWPVTYIDPELASGLTPDPVSGGDAFDFDNNDYVGAASDFFGAGGAHEFGLCSNPNTNVLTNHSTWPSQPGRQQVISGVEISNIVQEVSGDIVFDIQFNQGQRLLSVTGGQTLTRGSVVPIQWSLRNCGQWVRLLSSKDAGVTFQLLRDQVPNTGEYLWSVLQFPGSTYRIKVVSYYPGFGTGSDESESNITVVDTRDCSYQHCP